jgi:peptide subunit release factor 1 (eRF1)
MAVPADTRWGTAEEREQQVQRLRRPRHKERKRPQEVSARSLVEAVDRGGLISRRELRELVPAEETAMITLYLDFVPENTRPSARLTVFHSLRTEELENRREYIEGLSRDARLLLDRDIKEVEAFVAEYDPENERSIVAFKSGELNRVVTVRARTPNRLSIDPDAYVEPLEAILEQGHKLLVVHVEKERARLWTYQLGHEEAIDTIRSFVPTDTVDRSRPGTVQRHRRTHLHWHLRDVERATEAAFRERECEGLVLAGDEDVLAELEPMLPKAVRTAVVGTLHPDPHQSRNQWQAQIDELLTKVREREETAALEDLGMFAAHGLLVTGLAPVIDAVNLFRVRELLLNDTVAAPGHVCRTHHFCSLEGGSCPFCGRALLAVENIADELVEVALRNGIELVVVTRRHDLLEPHQGIAATVYPTSDTEIG